MSSQDQPRESVRSPGRILVVDDEASIRKAFGRVLQRDGHEITFAENGLDAIARLEGPPFDVVITDLLMPEMTGLDLLRAIRQRDLDVPVIVLTGSPTVESAAEALDHGAAQYLVKPVEGAVLSSAVARAIGLGRLARVKRDALAASTHPALHAMGDRIALELAFDRMMATVWSAYQPIVRANGSLFGYEALLRSKEPALPHPGAVLDAAEKLGRIEVLGRHMRALAAVPVAGDPSTGMLFVNLHPKDLFDEELTSEGSPLRAIASRVVLEVTERAAIESMDELRTRTAAIRACGFRLAIDDLGAGYAGLSAFAALEPEIVKLDMSLIRGIDASSTKRKIVERMCELCKDLGILIVAEGVETPEELRCVLDAGCDLLQGYLLARPGPAFPGFSWPADARGAV